MAKKKLSHRSRPEVGKEHKASKTSRPSGSESRKKTVAAKRSEANGDPPNHVGAYECHGVDFYRVDGDEHRAECPFCGKKSFSVNDKEGFFKCWDCGKQGNKYTFLQLFYEECYNATTPVHFKKLAKNRKLPVEAFEMAEVAYDAATKRWLIPVRSREGSMVNLRHWKMDVPNAFNMNTTSCKSHLYNQERLDNSPEIYVCEGEWDCIAMEWLLTAAKVKDVNVLAVPGADIFKEEWAKLFTDKKVTFFFDNDDRGREGMKKAADVLRAHTRCRELHQIKWPLSFPEKFDIRDYVSKNKAKPKRAVVELKRMVIDLPLHDRKSAGMVKESFDQVVKDFRERIYLSQDMKDALLLIFAVILSNRIFPDPYCPLWLFLVAPPGGGKTMLLQSTGDTDISVFRSTLTPRSLISGYKTPDGSDNSLLPHLIGKTLVVKDWTGIMSLSSGEQDEIYGVFRDAYDGRVEKSFGHMSTVRVYPEPGSGHDTCHFTILAGVTGAVHADRRANHGERFLKYQMMAPSGRDAIKQIEAAIDNTIESETPESELRASASAFIEYKLNQQRPLAKVPQWVIDRIVGLGQIVSTVRAVVLRKSGELVVRPESEVASRISKQLIKLGQAVAFVLDRKEIDEDCYRVMQRVGLDTCYGWHRDIIMTVAAAGKKGALREEISRTAVVSKSTTHRCLEDLFELGAVTYKNEKELRPDEKRRPGQPQQRWFLTEFMTDLFARAKIDSLIDKKVKREIKDRKKAKAKLLAKRLQRSPHSPPRKKKRVSHGKRRTVGKG